MPFLSALGVNFEMEVEQLLNPKCGIFLGLSVPSRKDIKRSKRHYLDLAIPVFAYIRRNKLFNWLWKFMIFFWSMNNHLRFVRSIHEHSDSKYLLGTNPEQLFALICARQSECESIQ
ncbi:hypothetical protein DOM22_07430 [Bdellovibrio sp. ZAP7]|nr:hypothetical protein DOM22_07430 [Bdellovibrio sp. ZAP7]